MSIKHLIYKVLISPPSVFITNIIVRHIYEGDIPHRNQSIDTNDASITPWVKTLIFWQMYETAELSLIDRYLPQDKDIVELGGSIGVVAANLASRLPENCKMVSVEANPNVINVLTRNINQNSNNAGIAVHHAAICYSPGVSDSIEMTFGDSTLAGWFSDCKEQRPKVPVPRITLTELLARNRIGKFVLVADIEGAEAGILACDQTALSNCSLMIIELHETIFDGRNYSIQDLLDMAADIGFSLKDSYRNVFILENNVLAAENTC